MSLSRVLILLSALVFSAQEAAQAQSTPVSSVGAKPDSALVKRINYHFNLLSKYRNLDVDYWMIEHGRRVLELAPQITLEQRKQFFTADEQKRFTRGLTLAYTSLAEAYGGRLAVDTALTYLAQGRHVLAYDSTATARIDSYIRRYHMVGKPAPTVTAQHWFVQDSVTSAVKTGSKTFNSKGQVTLLEFTAHWCPSCINSYPAVKRLQKQYGGRGLQVVMVTQTYGTFKGNDSISVADELKADSAYFVVEKKLPATIGVYVPEPVKNKNTDREIVPFNTDYGIHGIPQVMVIDREGIVRYIAVGWDPIAEGFLEKIIEQYL